MFKLPADGLFRVSHNVQTRNVHLAQPAFHRLTVCQQAFSYRGPHIWNSLPVDLRETNSLPVFKKKLKSHLLAHYL